MNEKSNLEFYINVFRILKTKDFFDSETIKKEINNLYQSNGDNLNIDFDEFNNTLNEFYDDLKNNKNDDINFYLIMNNMFILYYNKWICDKSLNDDKNIKLNTTDLNLLILLNIA